MMRSSSLTIDESTTVSSKKMYVRTLHRRGVGPTTVKLTQVAVSSLSPLYANPNDVFLGRGGARANHFYRKLIRIHAKKYYELRNGKKKDFIVSKIVEPILGRGGKFYVHNPADEAGVWRIGLYVEIIKKLRGALTDYWKKIIEYNGGKEFEEDKEDEEEEENAASPSTGTKRKATDSCDSRPTTILNKPRFLNVEATRETCETMTDKIPSLAVPIANSTPPRKTSLYLNEKTGHLLNMMSRESLYHDLLIRHADTFQERFGGSDPIDVLWNDDSRIRFVWDNVVSELQRTNFQIVLCPESQQSIDVDPMDLQLLGQDSKRIDITFRTIRCLIAALSDHEYIASEKISIQSSQEQNPGLTRQSSNNGIRGESMQLNVDELHRAMKHEDLHAEDLHRAIQHEERITMLQSPQFRKPQQDAAMVLPGQIPQTVALEAAYAIPNAHSIPPGMVQQNIEAACRQHRIALQQHPSSTEQTPEYLRLLQLRMEREAQTQMKNALTTRYAAQTGFMERERQIELMKRVIVMSENSMSNRNPHTAHVQAQQAVQAQRAVQAHQAVQAAFDQSRNESAPTDSSKWQSPARLAQALSEIKTTSHAETWDRHYKELLEYFLEHGDLRVPQHYGKDPTLGRFVTSVRYLRREKRRGGKRQLEEHREAQLEMIGFLWDLQRPEVPPYRKEQLRTECFILKEYGRTHPGARVPLGDPKYSWLAYWVESRRLAAKESNKVWDEGKLMLKLGFEWVCPTQYRKQQQHHERFVSQQQPRPSLPLSKWQQQQQIIAQALSKDEIII